VAAEEKVMPLPFIETSVFCDLGSTEEYEHIVLPTMAQLLNLADHVDAVSNDYLFTINRLILTLKGIAK
jgi:hypothetical protein